MPEYEDTRDPYERIAASIRAKVMSGEYGPGDALPSTRLLSKEYGAGGPTVQKALAMLKGEGWIIGQRGVGREVRPAQIREITAGSYFDPQVTGVSYDILSVDERDPSGDVATALNGERAVLRHRLMRDVTGPLEVDWSYYPASIAAGTRLTEARKIPRGGAPRILAELGHPERWFADVVSARAATEYEANHLRLPAGIPVLRILRTTYSDADRVVGVTVLVKAAHLLAQRYVQDVEA